MVVAVVIILVQHGPNMSASAGTTSTFDHDACVEQVTRFAAERGIKTDRYSVRYRERWVGAGHEIRRLPGATAVVPMPECQGVLAIDISIDCKILKSRGEGKCKDLHPLTFH